MGMTYWVHILNGRKIEGNQNDLSALHKAEGALDKLCAELGVAKLSSFQDTKDLEYNMAAVMGDDDEEEEELDPETGWAYGIDDMKWFDTAKGIRMFQAL